MKVFLFYSSESSGQGKRVESRLRELVPQEAIERFDSLERLTTRIVELLDEPALVVLIARDRSEITNMVTIREQLHAISTFLVVPDQDEETIKLAHKLRPRFLTFPDSDYADLQAVIGKKLRAQGHAGNT